MCSPHACDRRSRTGLQVCCIAPQISLAARPLTPSPHDRAVAVLTLLDQSARPFPLPAGHPCAATHSTPMSVPPRPQPLSLQRSGPDIPAPAHHPASESRPTLPTPLGRAAARAARALSHPPAWSAGARRACRNMRRRCIMMGSPIAIQTGDTG
ncbi:hypothetical protein BC834DRAFT_564947 [Gloeopeniophorella convolvens]|nr:hypothetical protein BC834DRAFT_564947 [Gloeopeniophorella convolvens]